MRTADALHPYAQLDHGWFPFRTLLDPTGSWLPEGKSVAVVVTVVLQYHPLDARSPFPVPGMLDRPAPDIGNFTQRLGGLHDGTWRLVEAARRGGCPVSFVVERRAMEHVTDAREFIVEPRNCVIAGGEHAVRLHTDAIDPNDERRTIRECHQAVERFSGRRVLGWRSPYCAQSSRTMQILAEEGLQYVCDFANDDRPYRLQAGDSTLLSLPLNHFASDLHFMVTWRQTVEEFVNATLRAADALIAEAATRPGPCMMPIVLHPWLSGASHRIAGIERLLSELATRPQLAHVNADQIYGAVSNYEHAD